MSCALGFRFTGFPQIPELATQEPGLLLFAWQMLRCITRRGVAGGLIHGKIGPRVQFSSLWVAPNLLYTRSMLATVARKRDTVAFKVKTIPPSSKSSKL